MKRWFIPVASLSAVAAAVVSALFLAGVFDGNEASVTEDNGTEVAGVCAPDHSDCEDTLVAPDLTDDDDGEGSSIAPVCAPGHSDCDDTVVIEPVCEPDTPDCADSLVGDRDGDIDVSEPPADPIQPVDGRCSGEEFALCEASATEFALADLQRRLGVDAEAVVVDDIEFAEWPDSCLAAAEEGEACAQVITPGFVIVFEAGGDQYEYHADLNGNVRLAQ